MRVFTVKFKGEAKTRQIVVDAFTAEPLAVMLDAASFVEAFNAPKMNPKRFKKFSSSLSTDCPDAPTDHMVSQSIIDAIDRINADRVKNHGGCYVESFIGGPGDFSPPRCNCDRCIAAGRAYKYESYEIAPSPQMLEYFHTLLVGMKETKRMRSGIEYTLPGKCRIAIYNQGSMSICSNKPEIRIGVYVFMHEEKVWRSAQ